MIAGGDELRANVVIACDGDGRIQETNAALRELVRRPDAALLGLPVTELLASPADVARARELALRATTGAARLVPE